MLIIGEQEVSDPLDELVVDASREAVRFKKL
jgi:hypothetical protein